MSAEIIRELLPLALGNVDEGTVVVQDEAGLRVRLDSAWEVHARSTRGPAPRPGDRVLVVRAPRGWVALAVIAPHDESGREANVGGCEVAFDGGDLVLRAPHGRVRIESGTDLELCAGRDLRQQAGRRTTLTVDAGPRAGNIELDGHGAHVAGGSLVAKGKRAELHAGDANVIVDVLSTHARALVTRVERLDITAGHIAQRARESLLEVSEVAEIRAERLKTRVRDAWSVLAGRTTIVSEEDTAIDGRKVLLG